MVDITRKQDQDDGSKESSRRLIEQAIAEGLSGAGRDRVSRASSPGDRAAFRQQCGQEITEIRGELKGSSDAMRQFNTAVEKGMQPGSQQYNQMFQQAVNGYMQVVNRANKDLYDLNP